MKKSILAIALALFTTIAFAQNKSKMSDWPELKAFHEVISQTFHPSEEGNLKPVKERAGELVIKAAAVQASKPPADFNTEKIKAAVNELVRRANEVKEVVDHNKDDALITKKLSQLHDAFHEIVGLCTGGEKHDEHEGHNH